MSSRKRRLDVEHKPARVLLSEVLPYELPVTFTNTGFYDFTKETSLSFDERHFRFTSRSNSDAGHDVIAAYLKILFGRTVSIKTHTAGPKNRKRVEYLIDRQGIDSSIPFTYRVRHKGGEARSLSIPHPADQIAIAAFYDRYSAAMLYYANQGEFSIRRPARITRYTLTRDSIFDSRRAKNTQTNEVEIASEESAYLRSFFVYDDFNNIQKFYGSKRYIDAEKRFGHLIHLDISKCFDSVYTHSLPWAVYGKEAVKSNLKHHSRTFGDEFDKVVRTMNDNETHGILIGPEFSRIFAEIILQRIDLETRVKLTNAGFIHDVDYRIYRYVDDYFIFMKRSEDRDVLVRHLEGAMAPYRFHLNYAKEAHHVTPFMSDMSMAKAKLRRGLEYELQLAVEQSGASRVYIFASSAKRLIECYKTVLSSTGLGPNELSNFVMAEVEHLLETQLSKVDRSDVHVEDIVPVADFVARDKNRRQIQKMLAAAAEFCFFVYSGSSKVSPSIKLARIVSLLRKFVRQVSLPKVLLDELDDLVYRELLSQLRRTPLSAEASIESLYLLTALGDLPRHYLLGAAELASSVGIERNEEGHYVVPSWFNVLIVSEVLRYMKDAEEFTELRLCIQEWVFTKVTAMQSSHGRAAEEPLLVLNCLGCPYLPNTFKASLLALYNVEDPETRESILSTGQKWFTGWHEFDLHDALQRKRFQEVY
ncbi:RNA-directed DNA polymerase [Arthrobacter sp. zg-Y411]|uniref:antiviral reverse transcriptase Drt3b n=1 Tax=Arthrobacter zhangbolii TaxID=2886936 RepID=UPI001D15DA1D|nr:antiviral reverse transcriptase Drt3b [Arthrobacter zhangbolii]MCC3293775.1 RNA-directed DNA polymerase [Arthrobacter zhangbolii]